MFNTALKYGGISAIILGAALLIPFLLLGDATPDYALWEVIGWTSMIVGQVTIVFAMMAWRKANPDKAFPYMKAVGLGLMVSCIAALGFVVADTFYITVVNPEFFNQYAEYEVEKMTAAGASQADIEALMAEYAEMTGTAGVVFLETVMFISVFLIGLVISLISAAFLSRKQPQESEAAAHAVNI